MRCLSTVLTEVIHNALKHGFRNQKSGQIVLRASRQGECIRIEVQDLGAGIASEHVGQVLDPFFTTARGQGLVGLGLTEAFNLVSHQLLGQLAIDGSEGTGCIVTIEIPASVAS